MARNATAEEQDHYKNLVTQVLGFISEPENTAELEVMVKKLGPAKGLAMMVSQALQGVGQAARVAGANVAKTTGQAALKEILTVLVSLMRAGGLVEDPVPVIQEAMQLIIGGNQNGTA